MALDMFGRSMAVVRNAKSRRANLFSHIPKWIVSKCSFGRLNLEWLILMVLVDAKCKTHRVSSLILNLFLFFAFGRSFIHYVHTRFRKPNDIVDGCCCLCLCRPIVTRVRSLSAPCSCDNDKFISIIKFLYYLNCDSISFAYVTLLHSVPHYDFRIILLFFFFYFALAGYIATDGYLFAWHTIIYNQPP